MPCSTSGHQAQWTDLRGFALTGANGGQRPTGANCNTAGDNRDTGYVGAWLSLAALWVHRRAVAGASRKLVLQGERVQGCGQLLGQWVLLEQRRLPVTFTPGSSAGTGSNIGTNVCGGVASGSGSAAAGSGTINGSGFVSGSRIAITGTQCGQHFTQSA